MAMGQRALTHSRTLRGYAGVVLAAALGLSALSASAQSPAPVPDDNTGLSTQPHRHRHTNDAAQPQAAALPALPPVHEVWPRLDPGAVM